VAVWTSGADSVSFGYDGAGRRVRKWTATTTTRYLSDGDDLLAELDAGGNRVAEYVYYPGIDRPHSVRRGGQTYYYAQDFPGNVTGLLSSTGGVTNQYRYGVWGAAELTVEGVPNSLRFAARQYDGETGLYYNRARYYDPALGRFISEDPLGLGAGINPYAFAGNDPVNGRDPSGLWCPKSFTDGYGCRGGAGSWYANTLGYAGSGSLGWTRDFDEYVNDLIHSGWTKSAKSRPSLDELIDMAEAAFAAGDEGVIYDAEKPYWYGQVPGWSTTNPYPTPLKGLKGVPQWPGTWNMAFSYPKSDVWFGEGLPHGNVQGAGYYTGSFISIQYRFPLMARGYIFPTGYAIFQAYPDEPLKCRCQWP